VPSAPAFVLPSIALEASEHTSRSKADHMLLSACRYCGAPPSPRRSRDCLTSLWSRMSFGFRGESKARDGMARATKWCIRVRWTTTRVEPEGRTGISLRLASIRQNGWWVQLPRSLSCLDSRASGLAFDRVIENQGLTAFSAGYPSKYAIRDSEDQGRAWNPAVPSQICGFRAFDGRIMWDTDHH
jgi:hypothetical protein